MVNTTLGFWDTISGFAYGIAFIGAAAGVGYVTATYVPKKFKPIGYIAAIGLGSYGAYSIYKKTKEEEGEPALPGETYPIVITDPTPGEEWSRILPHTVNVQVSNPYNVKKRIFVGMSMIHDETGEVFDFKILSGDIESGETIKTFWWMYGSPQGPGLYWIVSSVWDVFPVEDCEIQGTCHRLGIAESNVIFKLIG